ncbi:mitochondrial carrier protein RIM2 [Mycena crocata]|nr:mitochondrial carrier protein RIM2 [Mycena crocata]
MTDLPASISRSWHFVAGGIGGICGAVVTSPFEVVKIRLQSNLFQNTHTTAIAMQGGADSGVRAPVRRLNVFYNFVETGYILREIYRTEPHALFRGLGPTLAAIIPARSVNFFVYGNGKQLLSNIFNDGRENISVHLAAAAIAGIASATAANPIWVVKTRLQLDSRLAETRSRSSWATIQMIVKDEGIRGFYKGLSASYLGVVEGTIQWVLYEKLKRLTAGTKGRDGLQEWLGTMGSAGTAKCIASLVAYPHEAGIIIIVIRTRLRQPKVNGVVRYTGLIQTLQLVVAEEGSLRLYGGLSAHLMRVIPNAMVMYSVYEGILWWASN